MQHGSGWARLRSADDPDRLEFPEHYEEAAEGLRFQRLRQALESAFGCECAASSRPRLLDATFFGEVIVPASTSGGSADIVVRVSVFGSFAGVLAFAPPDHSGTLPQPHITEEDRARVLGILDELGYVLVPDDAWHLPYDGQNAAAREEVVSWADRFLGYVSPQ